MQVKNILHKVLATHTRKRIDITILLCVLEHGHKIDKVAKDISVLSQKGKMMSEFFSDSRDVTQQKLEPNLAVA